MGEEAAPRSAERRLDPHDQVERTLEDVMLRRQGGESY